MKLLFQSGILVLDDVSSPLPAAAMPLLRYDRRLNAWCARACDYRALVTLLHRQHIPFIDQAGNYRKLEQLKLAEELIPRPHQQEALIAWRNSGNRGIVALPTGSGKTILAVMAIAEVKRQTLVLVPTLDLLSQWVEVLERFFKIEIGMIGGGSHQVTDLTVCTYDSAVLQQEFIGDKFGLLIADECHHLSGKEYQLAASMCIAPFRLGLSATPELPDDKQHILYDQLGQVVCEKHIDELSGNVLSPYRVCCLKTALTAEEKSLYHASRQIYTDFLRRNNIDFNAPNAWKKFMYLAGRTESGRQAFAAFLTQRDIARSSRSKLDLLWRLLQRHAGERILIFTADNRTAYEIGRRFVLPVLTHHTGVKERKEFLQCFRDGTYPVLATSQVLNEGVDVPEASVGIVISGSGSVREHVQRLGRILRRAPDKPQAVLYEIVSGETGEESSGWRRRNHRAYRKWRS